MNEVDNIRHIWVHMVAICHLQAAFKYKTLSNKGRQDGRIFALFYGGNSDGYSQL